MTQTRLAGVLPWEAQTNMDSRRFQTPGAGHSAALVLALLTMPCARAQAPGKVLKITGEAHKLVLFSDGTVGGWGDTRDGQLGPKAAIPNNSGHSTVFVQVPTPGKVVDIAGGDRTSYFLRDDGTVWAMGWGLNGELGCGEKCTQPVDRPVQVAGVRDAVQVAAAGSGAMAVHRDGTVTAWGGQSGPKGMPAKVAGVSGVVQLSMGGGHTLARTSDGRVLAWGKLAVGRIYTDDPVEAPHEVAGLSGVASVVATGVAAVLKNDGTVWVWGNNQQAQFGNGRRDVDDSTRVPVRVPGVANVQALAGAHVGRHFLALRKDGTIIAWGNTDWGQVGNGVSGREQATPVVLKLAKVRAVYAAGNHSFAVLEDGSLWIWGVGSSYRGAWPLAQNTKLPVKFELPDAPAK